MFSRPNRRRAGEDYSLVLEDLGDNSQGKLSLACSWTVRSKFHGDPFRGLVVYFAMMLPFRQDAVRCIDFGSLVPFFLLSDSLVLPW